MPADRCERCDRPFADEWPAPPGTCGVRVASVEMGRWYPKRGPEAAKRFDAALEMRADADADCAAHEVDWPARCLALAAALRRFGQHTAHCALLAGDRKDGQEMWIMSWLPGDEASCTCGLGAAMKDGGGR